MEDNPHNRAIINEYRRLDAQAKRTYSENYKNSLENYLNKLNPDNKNNDKDTWNMYKRMQGKNRRTNKPREDEDGQLHVTKKPIAEAQNRYYQRHMTAPRGIIYPQQMLNTIEEAKQENRNPECNQLFNMQEMENAKKKLQPNKAYGTDEISNNFIIQLPNNRIQQLLGIYNRIWRAGKVPKAWKTGLIIPIPKPKKNLLLPESYRPITLLQCLSKLMENLISARINFLAEQQELLSNTQHGFRAGRSTLDPIVELEYEIRKGMVEGDVTVVVFFDLKAAFDSVDHTILLHTLAKLGLGGRLLTWIEDFIKDRYIRTIIEDNISNPLKITQGVPQGSGISGIAFILLLATISSLRLHPVKSKEFADDIILSITAKTIEEADLHMQIAIDMFEEWAKETGLTINTSKTKAMAFTNKGCPTPRLYLNNQEIEAVYKFKYLGITFDAPRLTWGDHIEDLLNSCENSLKLMKAMAFSKYGADRKSLLLLYTSVIRSKILYSSPMLITTCRSNLESLEQIQSKALRIATGALKSSPIEALQCEADIPSINLMIKEHAIKYYYKILTKPNNHPLYE